MKKKPSKVLIKRLKRALIARRSDVYTKYDAHDHPLSGMCYMASEAYFYLEGKKLGFKPMRATYRGISHWWLEDKNGNILDLTKEQFVFKFPYEKGKPAAFLTKTPSRRTKKVMDLL